MIYVVNWFGIQLILVVNWFGIQMILVVDWVQVQTNAVVSWFAIPVIWLSIDLRFKWFGCQLLWDSRVSNDLRFKWFGIQMILAADWFENQLIWLSNDLRFKWFGCQWVWDSSESEMSFSARLPSKMKLLSSKTKLFCETSFKNDALKLKNETFLRDFLQKWSCEADMTSFSARLPSKMKLWSSKTKLLGETSKIKLWSSIIRTGQPHTLTLSPSSDGTKPKKKRCATSSCVMSACVMSICLSMCDVNLRDV